MSLRIPEKQDFSTKDPELIKIKMNDMTTSPKNLRKLLAKLARKFDPDKIQRQLQVLRSIRKTLRYSSRHIFSAENLVKMRQRGKHWLRKHNKKVTNICMSLQLQ